MSSQFFNSSVTLYKRCVFHRANRLISVYFASLISISALLQLIAFCFSLYLPVFHLKGLQPFLIEYTFWYTLLLLLPFVYCLHLVIGYGNLKATILPICRVVVPYLILFFLPKLFHLLSQFVPVYGHTYYNIYGVLAILEEVRCFHLWDLVEYLAETILGNKKLKRIISRLIESEISKENQDKLVTAYKLVSTYLKLNFAALSILLVFLVASSVLCVLLFSITDIVASSVVSAILWFLTYRVVTPICKQNVNSMEAHWDLIGIIDEDDEDEAEKGESSRTKSYGTVDE